MLRKKLLSLGLAGAMVASMGVGAFADVVSGNESDTLKSNMQVAGSVKTKDGQAPAGTLEVEVPTSAAFMVDQQSKVTAASFTVENRSAVPVIVNVKEFSETDTTGGITIKKESDFNTNSADLDRSNVKLKLQGNGGTVDLGTVLAEKTPQKLLEVAEMSSQSVQIIGEAGTKDTNDTEGSVDQKGANENFEIVFEIKKKA